MPWLFGSWSKEFGWIHHCLHFLKPTGTFKNVPIVFVIETRWKKMSRVFGKSRGHLSFLLGHQNQFRWRLPFECDNHWIRIRGKIRFSTNILGLIHVGKIACYSVWIQSLNNSIMHLTVWQYLSTWSIVTPLHTVCTRRIQWRPRRLTNFLTWTWKRCTQPWLNFVWVHVQWFHYWQN